MKWEVGINHTSHIVIQLLTSHITPPTVDRELISAIITGFVTLTLISQIFLGIFVIIFFLEKLTKSNKSVKKIIQTLSSNSLSFAFLVSVVATLGSLFLSEVALFIPCKLCWFQRIFMYPQVLLLGIATFKNDFGVRMYIIPLSAIGLTIAIYHYILQMSPIPLPCTDEVASCAARQFAQFGYITIPLMSLTAFFLILVFMFLSKKK